MEEEDIDLLLTKTVNKTKKSQSSGVAIQALIEMIKDPEVSDEDFNDFSENLIKAIDYTFKEEFGVTPEDILEEIKIISKVMSHPEDEIEKVISMIIKDEIKISKENLSFLNQEKKSISPKDIKRILESEDTFIKDPDSSKDELSEYGIEINKAIKKEQNSERKKVIIDLINSGEIDYPEGGKGVKIMEEISLRDLVLLINSTSTTMTEEAKEQLNEMNLLKTNQQFQTQSQQRSPQI